MRWVHRAAPAATVLALLCAAAPARGNSGGIVGRSGKTNQTCNACHSGGTRPTVSFAGPTAAAPGETITLTFSVHAATPAQRAAGFNVAVQNGGGTLATLSGQDERLSGGELTHTEPKDNDAGRNASWDFRWTAPTTPGSYRLFGAGNSVNHNGQSSGDRSNTTRLDIDVVAGAATPTPTETALPPSPTPTPTATALPPSPTATSSPSATPSASATGQRSATATVAPSDVPSPTAAASQTASPTIPSSPTATDAATAAATPSPSVASSQTAAPSATQTAAASPTTSAPVTGCGADCNGDGAVAISELITAVSIALGTQPLQACAGLDLDGDGRIAINELIAGVNNALVGCD
ncbi:MAG: choice-of-anchor V domain-containing protein [bacterium]